MRGGSSKYSHELLDVEQKSMRDIVRQIGKNPFEPLSVLDDAEGLSVAEMERRLAKNCYELGTDAARCLVVCFDGSPNARAALNHALRTSEPTDHIVLITVRDESSSYFERSIEARWRLQMAVKRMLVEPVDSLEDQQRNYTALYPTVTDSSVPSSLVRWAKRMKATQVLLGASRRHRIERHLRQNLKDLRVTACVAG